MCWFDELFSLNPIRPDMLLIFVYSLSIALASLLDVSVLFYLEENSLGVLFSLERVELFYAVLAQVAGVSLTIIFPSHGLLGEQSSGSDY